MILYWAFAGDNPTRKNYFRAIIVWFLIGMTLWISLALIGLAPALIDIIDQILNKPSTDPVQGSA